MPAYKNKDSGSWYVVTQYTDWTGERKQKSNHADLILYGDPVKYLKTVTVYKHFES